MKASIYVRVLIHIFGKVFSEARKFFVQWFLPLPPVDELDDPDGWKMDDDDEPRGPAATQSPVIPPPVQQSQNDTAGSPPPPEPAPEVRPPEGADDRSARQPNMPNPFA